MPTRLLCLALIAAAAPAGAKTYEVKMLNKGAAGFMVFEPAFLKVAPGDTVTFRPTDPGHDAETIPGLLPAGAQPFRGGINRPVSVTFAVPGLYAYKCTPHLSMGMVGLVQVGAAGDRAAVAAGAAKLPGLAKARLTGLLAQAK